MLRYAGIRWDVVSSGQVGFGLIGSDGVRSGSVGFARARWGLLMLGEMRNGSAGLGLEW